MIKNPKNENWIRKVLKKIIILSYFLDAISSKRRNRAISPITNIFNNDEGK